MMAAAADYITITEKAGNSGTAFIATPEENERYVAGFEMHHAIILAGAFFKKAARTLAAHEQDVVAGWRKHHDGFYRDVLQDDSPGPFAMASEIAILTC